MATNRGKAFEDVIREAFKRLPNTTVTRLPDPVQGYLGIRNICDFIIYNYPYQYFIECKSVHGNTLSFSNITDNQYHGMLEVSQVKGVIAGVICWWVDRDVTRFIPVQVLQVMKNIGLKSMRYDFEDVPEIVNIKGTKKKVFFAYDMDDFFHQIVKSKRGQ